MPLYEYRCADCGHELEVLQKMSDPAPVNCPACHHAALQKKLSAAGFQLKGTGWYVTDFRGGTTATAPAATARPGEGGADAGKPAGSTASAGEGGGATPAAAGSAGSAAATPAPAASPSSTPAAPPSNAG